MKAEWNGAVLAQSDETIVVEGNHYFPPASVRREYLEPSQTQTVCSWKGTASYYTLNVNGERNPDAAWYYSQPKDEVAHLRDYVAFWKGVRVS